MKHRLELKLDLITDTSPLEVASKVEQAVREAVETVKQSLGTEPASMCSLSSTVATCASCWSRYNPQSISDTAYAETDATAAS
jgi:hypothetical protein